MSTAAAASSSSMDSDIPRIIDFWFNTDTKPPPPMRWFVKNDELDREIRDRFGKLVHKARTTELDSWTDSPDGTLALLVLLDQFPRNLFRGSPDSWSSDAKAVDVATKAVLKGFDRAVPELQQAFFYLPFMHDEDLKGHVASRALYEQYCKRCKPDTLAASFAQSGLQSALQHTDVILRFGRYPSRNAVLGRESTQEELDFLNENPSGFAGQAPLGEK